jgi:hypothetical protein
MTDAWGRLHVEVLEDEIIITLPFTNYTVKYYKPANSPGFLAKNFPTKDSRFPMTQAEFLERAWKLANDKARELGWICLALSPRRLVLPHALRPTRASASEVTRTRPASSTLVPAS